MVVGAISSRTELAIVGAGPGGYVAALRAADAGLDVTLIDRGDLGGTCLNVGCIPSKTLIETANIVHHARSAGGRGVTASVDVHMHVVNEHLATVTGQLRSGVVALLSDAGVTVVSGDCSFARYDRLSVVQGDQVSHLEFDNVIIATGSRPIELDSVPFGGRVVSSTGALSLGQVPSTMTVVGGGYVGVELGTAWAKLGSQVTIIEASDTLLPGVARELVRPVRRQLHKLGVRVLTSQTAVSVSEDQVTLGNAEILQADVVVVSIGRAPNSDQASIDTLPVEIAPSGHIVVDPQMRAAQNIYAIGDIVAGPALAHKASAQAEVAVEAILRRPVTFDPAAIPAVIFCDPEIMTVGVTLDQANNAGWDVHRFPHAASARARTIGQSTGATYIVVDDHETVIGVHAVGPHVSELTGEAALAIEMAATVEDLALTVHTHPTVSESLAEAAWLARGMPLHIRR